MKSKKILKFSVSLFLAANIYACSGIPNAPSMSSLGIVDTAAIASTIQNINPSQLTTGASFDTKEVQNALISFHDTNAIFNDSEKIALAPEDKNVEAQVSSFSVMAYKDYMNTDINTMGNYAPDPNIDQIGQTESNTGNDPTQVRQARPIPPQVGQAGSNTGNDRQARPIPPQVGPANQNMGNGKVISQPNNNAKFVNQPNQKMTQNDRQKFLQNNIQCLKDEVNKQQKNENAYFKNNQGAQNQLGNRTGLQPQSLNKLSGNNNKRQVSVSKQITMDNGDKTMTKVTEMDFSMNGISKINKESKNYSSDTKKLIKIIHNYEERSKNLFKFSVRVVTFDGDGAKNDVTQETTRYPDGKVRVVNETKIVDVDGNGKGTGVITITTKDGQVTTYEINENITVTQKTSTVADPNNDAKLVTVAESANGTAIVTADKSTATVNVANAADAQVIADTKDYVIVEASPTPTPAQSAAN